MCRTARLRRIGEDGRKPTTGRSFGVLFEIWRHSEQPCGKRLVPMLGDWLPFYEKHRGELKVATREAILKISPAQVDRVLASKKISRGVGQSADAENQRGSQSPRADPGAMLGCERARLARGRHRRPLRWRHGRELPLDAHRDRHLQRMDRGALRPGTGASTAFARPSKESSSACPLLDPRSRYRQRSASF